MNDDRPSLSELQREEHEDQQRETYETRYQGFCQREHLDPDDVGSVLAYEREWADEEERFVDDARERDSS